MRVAPGSVDVSLYFNLGSPSLDVTALDTYYIRSGRAISAKTDCTALAAADSPHSDGKAYHCGLGIYRVDFEDAAFAAGVPKVQCIVVDGNGDVSVIEVELASLPTASEVALAVATVEPKTLGNFPDSLGWLLYCLHQAVNGYVVVDRDSPPTIKIYSNNGQTLLKTITLTVEPLTDTYTPS